MSERYSRREFVVTSTRPASRPPAQAPTMMTRKTRQPDRHLVFGNGHQYKNGGASHLRRDGRSR